MSCMVFSSQTAGKTTFHKHQAVSLEHASEQSTESFHDAPTKELWKDYLIHTSVSIQSECVTIQVQSADVICLSSI